MSGKRREKYKRIITGLLVAAMIYAIDQFSKLLVQSRLHYGQSVPMIGNIFHMTLIDNTGAAFGLFRDHPSLFIVITMASISAILFFLLFRSEKLSPYEMAALSFILGGALGNLKDRLTLGHVVDFIDLRVWPVFNAADSFITIGALILTWSILRTGRTPRARWFR